MSEADEFWLNAPDWLVAKYAERVPNGELHSMGACVKCGAPIFTADAPVDGQPCLDCIMEDT